MIKESEVDGNDGLNCPWHSDVFLSAMYNEGNLVKPDFGTMVLQPLQTCTLLASIALPVRIYWNLSQTARPP